VELPQVVAVDPTSPAHEAGVLVGDAIDTINGERPRDVIRYQLLVDEALVTLEVVRGGLTRTIEIDKGDGQPLGIEVDAAVFDQVRTCDNHCSFCFIYQLPKGMRRSLYLKDDDYRLSFLYGNFTTLTRFTEADLERVITEGLSPLYVSIHATDGNKRAELLRNRRGATSLRWLRALLDTGVEVNGQVVVCPGVNDGAVLEQTLLGVLDEYPELATLAVVPLGISDHSDEPAMRAHTVGEAEAVVDLVEEWQSIYRRVLGRPLVYAADEYHLLAGRPFPPAEAYGDFAMHEDGIGMARAFEREFLEPDTGPDGRERGRPEGRTGGFFTWVDGAPALGYRAPRTADGGSPVELSPTRSSRSSPDRTSLRRPIGIITGRYGAEVLAPLVDAIGCGDVRLVPVDNRFFGGNIAVTGLLVGADIARHLADEPTGHRYLLPDVCLSGGRFLDGMGPEELPRPVEIVPTDGRALRLAIDAPGHHRHRRPTPSARAREAS
jgi:putative radical SAM enzyme (TIGR03279 family)